jgi:hypothetical protein
MAMKFQMTSQGMQSFYTLAWRQGVATARTLPVDPIFSGYSSEEAGETSDLEAQFLAEAVIARQPASAGRLALLESAVRSEAYAKQAAERRPLDLFKLGYSGL